MEQLSFGAVSFHSERHVSGGKSGRDLLESSLTWFYFAVYAWTEHLGETEIIKRYLRHNCHARSQNALNAAIVFSISCLKLKRVVFT